VITIKDQDFTVDYRNIRRLAEEIKAAWPTPVVIVHGGGSFGHPMAKKYDITDGVTSDRQIHGFAKTHQAMVELNSIIVNAFLDTGLPAISVSPSSFIVTDDGRISKVDLEIMGKLVVQGVLPFIFGDAVLDRKKGFTILSGDQLAVRLAVSLKATKLIFGVDVDGIFTSNPKLFHKARLIERLESEKVECFANIGKSLSTDVTGGMLGKISEARMAVREGIDVLFVNATEPNVILKALKGEPVTGTILTG
jgi:isopentenyl phosphate kinase|tara:strand:+ start:3560 stop:4312 length:753 start_codon:yes stop_codon:yes gene_type:complete